LAGIHEFSNVCICKKLLSHEKLDYLLGRFSDNFSLVLPSVQVAKKAVQLHHRHQFAYYDALIVAAALDASCPILYTEDMKHGMQIEGLQIPNPFNDKALNINI